MTNLKDLLFAKNLLVAIFGNVACCWWYQNNCDTKIKTGACSDKEGFGTSAHILKMDLVSNETCGETKHGSQK